ncbi:MAG: nucleotidyltransferase domain-containing protein [Acidimicrobiales bacterium]
MDVAEPSTVVIAPTTAKVLRVLVSASADFTVRDLARLAGVSHTRARQVIDRLAEHGLVQVDRTRSGNRCRFNPDHLAAPAVAALVSLRAVFLEVLAETISLWTLPPAHASLFGSAARGDGDTSSDLDVLVIRPAKIAADDPQWESQLADTAAELRRRTGNDVAWFVLDAGELAAASAVGEPVVGDWSRDAVHLAGTRLDTLLRSRSAR